VTIVSRAGGVTATSRSSNLTGPYARCDPGGPDSKKPAGNNTVRRIILTLLATACAITALSGCGAPVADANSGTASIAAVGH
jgi:hypothetical protein